MDYCDLCGRELKDNAGHIYLELKAPIDSDKTTINLNLCDECYEAFELSLRLNLNGMTYSRKGIYAINIPTYINLGVKNRR